MPRGQLCGVRACVIAYYCAVTDGITDVIIYNSPDDIKKKNRGFAFLEYDSHKSASMAKHRIGNGYTRVWGCDIIVDWADPQEEPDEETMSKVTGILLLARLTGQYCFAGCRRRLSSAKLGWNQCSSFDNVDFVILCVFGLKMPIHAPKWSFLGVLTP